MIKSDEMLTRATTSGRRASGTGGAVRAGFVHYNTQGEVDRLLDALAAL